MEMFDKMRQFQKDMYIVQTQNSEMLETPGSAYNLQMDPKHKQQYA